MRDRRILRKRRLMYAAALLLGIAVIVIVGVIGMKQTNSGRADGPYNGHGGTFKNPLIDMDTPDPSVVYKDGYYYMTFTHHGTDVMVMKSRTIDFKQAEKKVVWYPPIDTMYSANLWAPEIQYIRGKWYIYFAADDGQNENHRMYALEAAGDDPLGEYEFKGQITDETNKWAIDGLAMEHEGQLYFVWSGWEGDVNIRQNTYIAPMSDALTISGPRVMLSSPDQEWEMAGGPPYIQEGQSILYRDGRVFIVYSGAGSWTPFYSLGLLALKDGGDPLQPEDWEKAAGPLMTMDEEAGVYGPGHNSFVKLRTARRIGSSITARPVLRMAGTTAKPGRSALHGTSRGCRSSESRCPWKRRFRCHRGRAFIWPSMPLETETASASENLRQPFQRKCPC